LLPESRTEAIFICSSGEPQFHRAWRQRYRGGPAIESGDRAMWIVIYVAMAASLQAMANLMQIETDEDRERHGDD
jgi:hypothetical protein